MSINHSITLSSADSWVSGVRSENVDSLWPVAKKHISEALKYADGKYTLESIYEAILRKEQQLWVILDASGVVGAGTTSIHQYPAKKVCVAMFCGSEKSINWSEHFKVVEDWARTEGCQGCEIIGRPGWERVMQYYKKLHVVLGKAL